MRGRLPFRIVAGVLVLGAVVHIATLWPRVATLSAAVGARSWLIVAAFAITALTALAACALAVLLLWKAPDRPDARVLALFLAFLAVFWGSLFRFMEVDAGGRSFSVQLSYGTGWVSQSALAAFLLASAAFLRFSALFPERLTAETLPAVRFRAARPLRALRRLSLRPSVVWGTAAAVYLAQRFVPRLFLRLEGAPVAPGAVPPLFLASLVAVFVALVGYALSAILLGTRNLLDSHRAASPADRPRTLWLVTGFTAAAWMVAGAVGLIIVSALSGLDADVVTAAIPLALVLAPLVLVAGAAVGILYSGAIDPALALDRSTVYGGLGATGIVAFAGIENALSEAVEGWVQLPGVVGPVLTGAVVALALIPVRAGLRKWVGRRSADSPGGSSAPAAATASGPADRDAGQAPR